MQKASRRQGHAQAMMASPRKRASKQKVLDNDVLRMRPSYRMLLGTGPQKPSIVEDTAT
jgi:hypothetical protein